MVPPIPRHPTAFFKVRSRQPILTKDVRTIPLITLFFL